MPHRQAAKPVQLHMDESKMWEATNLRMKHADEIAQVCDETGMQAARLFSNQRGRSLVNARAMLAHMLWNKGLSSVQIGILMNRNHSSVLHLLGRTRRGKLYAEKFDRQPQEYPHEAR